MVNTFFDLNAWKKGHSLILDVYSVLNNYPQKEEYALTSQIRRCPISITSNIAEGFSRKSKKEKISFYFISKGSLTELQNQLYLSKDLKYISTKIFNELYQQSVIVDKLISGLIKSASDKPE